MKITSNKKIFIETFIKESKTDNHVKVGYYDDYKSNIYGQMPVRYLKMFAAGDGNELFGKACAIHSSSMLAYNMFSWIDNEHPLTYNKVRYTNVFFEVHLPTLIGTQPANMDIVLEGTRPNDKHSIMFIESKFTEYFSNAKDQMKKMGITYSKPERYYINNGKDWDQLIEHYRKEANAKNSYGYYDGIKQEICHLIAISNLRTDAGISAYNSLKKKYDCDTPRISEDDDFIFVNLLFKPGKNFVENEAFTKYKTLYDDLQKSVCDLIRDKGIVMDMQTYGDLWNIIKEQMPLEQKEYVENKYMNLSE